MSLCLRISPSSLVIFNFSAVFVVVTAMLILADLFQKQFIAQFSFESFNVVSGFGSCSAFMMN